RSSSPQSVLRTDGGLDRVADLHVAVLAAGDRTADQDQPLVGQHLGDLEVLDGHGLVAHLAGHPLALEHAAGGQATADRAAVTEDLVLAVGPLLAGHVVALHHALVALALAGPGHVDLLTGGEEGERDPPA